MTVCFPFYSCDHGADLDIEATIRLDSMSEEPSYGRGWYLDDLVALLCGQEVSLSDPEQEEVAAKAVANVSEIT